MLQINRLKKNIEVRDTLNKTTSKNWEGCLVPIEKPKGGHLHYWAVFEDVNGPNFLVRRQIGFKSSQDGEAHEICFIDQEKSSKDKYICKKTDIDPIVKLVPINRHPMKNIGNIRLHPWKELYITQLASTLFINGISPHFMYFYKVYVCGHANDSMFKNVNIIRRFQNKNVTQKIKHNIVDIGNIMHQLHVNEAAFDKLKFNYDMFLGNLDRLTKPDYGVGVLTLMYERGDQDLSKFLDSQTRIETSVAYTLIFQILQALTSLHECMEIVHLDLHLYNILVKKAPQKHENKKLYRRYQVYDAMYYVPNIAFDILIIDFGRSEFLDRVDAESLAEEAKGQYNFLFSTNENKTEQYYKHVLRNLNKNLPFYREYFKSFDVWRVCTELHIALRDSVDQEVLELLRNIIKDSKLDFIDNLATYNVSGNGKNYIYHGHPGSVMEKYFYKKGIFVDDLKNDEWLQDSNYVVNDKYMAYGFTITDANGQYRERNRNIANNVPERIKQLRKQFKVDTQYGGAGEDFVFVDEEPVVIPRRRSKLPNPPKHDSDYDSFDSDLGLLFSDSEEEILHHQKGGLRAKFEYYDSDSGSDSEFELGQFYGGGQEYSYNSEQENKYDIFP